MAGWNDYLVKREQYRDQLREAENYRLMKQAKGDCHESEIGRVARGVLAAIRNRKSDREETPCGGPTRLVEKTA
jgi:hypothetical protein